MINALNLSNKATIKILTTILVWLITPTPFLAKPLSHSHGQDIGRQQAPLQ